MMLSRRVLRARPEQWKLFPAPWALNRRYNCLSVSLSSRNPRFPFFSNSTAPLHDVASMPDKSSGWRVLMFASDNVSAPTLRKLYEEMHNSSGADPPLVSHLEILCTPDRVRRKGRSKVAHPIKDFASENNIPIHFVPEHLRSLKKWDPPISSEFDVGVVVSFGFFIPPHIIEKFPYGAINMHPSLLPKYRGPAPLHHVLLNGEQQTGVSIIDVSPSAFDVGLILHQETYPLAPTTTYTELLAEMSEHGAECVVKCLRELQSKRKTGISQDSDKGCHAPKLKAEDAEIRWETMSAKEVVNRWRALQENAYTTVNGKRVKIVELDLQLIGLAEESSPASESTPPAAQAGEATLLRKEGVIEVTCKEGKVRISALQPEGKKVMKAVDFANGVQGLTKRSVMFG